MVLNLLRNKAWKGNIMKLIKYILLHSATLLILIPFIAFKGDFSSEPLVFVFIYFMISVVLQVEIPIYTAKYARKHGIINHWINFVITLVLFWGLHYVGLLPTRTQGSITIDYRGIFNVTCITVVPAFVLGFIMALIYQIKDNKIKRQNKVDKK